MKRRFSDERSNLEARFTAQRLAFGPMMFQAARVLRDSGALEFLRERALDGATPEELADEVDLSLYAAGVLLEAGLAAEIVQLEGGRYVLTKVGYLVLRDHMTRVNMNFVHDVCYRPMFHLDAAIRTGRPVGLQEHGEWKTVYEGLSELPKNIRDSWLAFDHYYSDGVFERVVPMLFERKLGRVLDVGGNTGKFALCCCKHDPQVQVTIVDLPGQLAVALENARAAGLATRISGQAVDMLDSEAPLPRGFDAIWMSQFLDCFCEEEIVSILTRTAISMADECRLYILEPYWNRQAHEAARYSVINTSLYFTAVANGNSKMYHSQRMMACLQRAGLEVEREVNSIGYHTLFCCKKKGGIAAPLPPR